MQVSVAPPDSIDILWPRVAPLVDKALRHGEGDSTTLEHFHEGLTRGELGLWVVHEDDDIVAIVVFQVLRHPAKTTLFVTMVAGRDMARWVEQVQGLLVDYKRLIGADTLEASCRDGMVRNLMRHGWQRKATIMELKT